MADWHQFVTDLLKALLDNGSVNTPLPTCTQQEECFILLGSSQRADGLAK
jgi:hypothetical protein